MGFLSGLFGGGGGGSSTTNTTTNNLDIKPVTNVSIPLDELAEAIKQSSEIESKTKLIEISKAEQAKEQENSIMQTIANVELKQKDNLYKFLGFAGVASLVIWAYKKGKI